MKTVNREGTYLRYPYPYSTGKYFFVMTTAINPNGSTEVPEEAVAGSIATTTHVFGKSSSFVSDGEFWKLGGSQVDIEIPAVSRVVRGTCTGAGTLDSVITLGGLVGIVGTDLATGSNATEFAARIKIWSNNNSHFQLIPIADADLDFIDNGDGTFDITCISGFAANSLVFSTDDPALSFEEITAGQDVSYEQQGINSSFINYAPANAIMKSDGTNAVASQATDDGSTFLIGQGEANVSVNSNGAIILRAGDSNTRVDIDNSTQTIAMTAVGGVSVNGPFSVTSGDINASGLGSVDLEANNITLDAANSVKIPGLPTTDPGDAGQLYTSAGVLMVSIG